MRFVKLHGAGNDFIAVNAMQGMPENPGPLAKRVCERRFSIGADGLICITPSKRADVTMRIFNSDGSEAEMCGNGIRCAAKFAWDEGICTKNPMAIDTLAGVKIIEIEPDGTTARITVDMGEPCFEPDRIPVAADTNRVVIEMGGHSLEFFCSNTGVPHAVTFSHYPDDDEEFRRLGATLEWNSAFPAGANIEFCRVESPSSVRVKVWERGAGPTLACGTGSCAVLVAGASLGLLKREADIHLPGGVLHDRWAENNRIFMTGPAETVFEGSVE